MPEGDVIRVAVAQLGGAFTGAELILTDFRVPQCATSDLAGRRTLEVAPYGKNMLHRVEGGLTIHSHFKMDGTWRMRPTRQVTDDLLRSRHVRCVLATQEWTALGHRLGLLDVLRTEDEERLVTGRLGPDVMADGFDPDEAAARLDRPREVGALLLDQTVVAGIGTIYASESLRRCRVNPWAQGGALDTDTRSAVLRTARALLLQQVENVLRHGWRSATALGFELPESADWRLVHGRSGEPCRACGRLVRVSGIGPDVYRRPMFYCATCQGGLAPGDDGRPLAPLGAHGGRGWN